MTTALDGLPDDLDGLRAAVLVMRADLAAERIISAAPFRNAIADALYDLIGSDGVGPHYFVVLVLEPA
jgi:hypothetical protein